MTFLVIDRISVQQNYGWSPVICVLLIKNTAILSYEKHSFSTSPPKRAIWNAYCFSRSRGHPPITRDQILAAHMTHNLFPSVSSHTASSHFFLVKSHQLSSEELQVHPPYKAYSFMPLSGSPLLSAGKPSHLECPFFSLGNRKEFPCQAKHPQMSQSME